MGIHYDFKSKRGERAMLKEAKRKARLAKRKAKRMASQPKEINEEPIMHDISKTITLDDLTNPDKNKQLANISMRKQPNKKDSIVKSERALRKNLQKRKKFVKTRNR